MAQATGNLRGHTHVGKDISKYMESFHVSTMFRNLLQDLVKEKPENPIPFLMEKLQSHTTYKIVLIGPPASGKGTQCELLVNKFGITHVSTGDLLRAEVAAGSKLGLEAKTYMDAAQLVPNHLVTDMVQQRIVEPDCRHNGWILDGFPRTVEQATSLRSLGIEPDLIICLNVSDEEVEERVVGRWSDPVTGKIYHLKFNPPPSEIRGRLVQRIDDNTEKVKAMLDNYHAETEPVLQFYDEGLIKEVDGTRGKLKVFGDICDVLQGFAEKVRKRAELRGR